MLGKRLTNVCETTYNTLAKRRNTYAKPLVGETTVSCKILKPSKNEVAVAYERWSLTRGSNCSDLTGKFWGFGLVVAHDSCLREVVAIRKFECFSK